MAARDDRSSLTQRVLGYSGLLFSLAIVLIPYTYVALSAFKPPGEIFEVKWLPIIEDRLGSDQ